MNLSRLPALAVLAVAGGLLLVPGSSASAELDAECGAPCFIHVSFYGTGSGQIVATWQEDGPKQVACRVDCIVPTDFGRAGDRISGGPGNDTLYGERGDDRLTGGPGRDRLNGGSGSDTIRAKDGDADSVNGGSGKDLVYADRRDRVRLVERRL